MEGRGVVAAEGDTASSPRRWPRRSASLRVI